MRWTFNRRQPTIPQSKTLISVDAVLDVYEDNLEEAIRVRGILREEKLKLEVQITGADAVIESLNAAIASIRRSMGDDLIDTDELAIEMKTEFTGVSG